jgi:uncharacterized membrane protein YjjP (DUF1212 family)
LVEHNELKQIETDEAPRWLTNFAAGIAVAAVATGFFLLAVTLIAYFAGY